MAWLLAIVGLGHRVMDGPARRLAYARPAVRQSARCSVLVAARGLDAARA